MIETTCRVCAIVLLCLVMVGCNDAGRSAAPSAEEETVGAAIYVEETLNVGTDTYIDSVSPIGRYGVVFSLGELFDPATGGTVAVAESRTAFGATPRFDHLQGRIFGQFLEDGLL